MADKDEILINSRQSAELLEMSPDVVNNMARKQLLPGVKRGRQGRFRKDDILLAQRQTQEQLAAEQVAA